MPIHPSTLRHVLSLAIPYIPQHTLSTAIRSSTTLEGRRSLHAFSRKRLGKGLNADHLIGRLRHPPREHGSPGSRADVRRGGFEEDYRGRWEERVQSAPRPKGLRRPTKPLAQWWMKDRVRPGGEDVAPARKVEYVTDAIGDLHTAKGTKRLVSRTKRYISHLHPSYLSTLPTDQLVFQVEDFRIILHHLQALEGWRKAPWVLHSALRYTWSGLARVLHELDKRGEAERLLKPDDFDGILQSLMIYHPKTSSPRTSRRIEGEGTSGGKGAEAGPVDEEFDLGTAQPELPADQYTTLTVPTIFHLISLNGFLPTHKQLLHLARSTSLTVLPSTPHAQAQRTWAAVTHIDIARASDAVWTRRRDMIESITDLWPGVVKERLYEEEIVQGVDECDILLHGNLAAMSDEEVNRLREGVAYWTTRRAAIYAKKRATVMDEVSRRQEHLAGGEGESTRASSISLGRDLAWLIRDSLVASRLRHQSAGADMDMTTHRHMGVKPDKAYGVPSNTIAVRPYDLDRPLDLFRLLLTVLVNPEHSSAAVSPGAIKVIVSCVIRLRNAFYHNHDFGSLLSLVHILGVPPTSIHTARNPVPISAVPGHAMQTFNLPALPSEVHATLLCVGHQPTPPLRVRQLLVALHHLPVPSTPLNLGSYTRRYLNFVAQECDRQRRYTSNDPSSPFVFGRADDDVRERHRTGGWRSVLQGLYVKWGEGYSMEEWSLRQRVTAADHGDGEVTQEERSRLRGIKRQVAARLLAEDHRVGMTGKGDNILVRPRTSRS